jgi:uncharacterized protein (DUF983 family)
MFEERTEQLHRILTLLDVVVTSLMFLAASWVRNALLDDDPVDLLSHLALLPFIKGAVMGAIWVSKPELAHKG